MWDKINISKSKQKRKVVREINPIHAFINFVGYMRGDEASPFHWLGNRRIQKTVIELFEKEIEKGKSE